MQLYFPFRTRKEQHVKAMIIRCRSDHLLHGALILRLPEATVFIIPRLVVYWESAKTAGTKGYLRLLCLLLFKTTVKLSVCSIIPSTLGPFRTRSHEIGGANQSTSWVFIETRSQWTVWVTALGIAQQQYQHGNVRVWCMWLWSDVFVGKQYYCYHEMHLLKLYTNLPIVRISVLKQSV